LQQVLQLEEELRTSQEKNRILESRLAEIHTKLQDLTEFTNPTGLSAIDRTVQSTADAAGSPVRSRPISELDTISPSPSVIRDHKYVADLGRPLIVPQNS
jgi:hypothetical protein